MGISIDLHNDERSMLGILCIIRLVVVRICYPKLRVNVQDLVVDLQTADCARSQPVTNKRKATLIKGEKYFETEKKGEDLYSRTKYTRSSS